MAAAGGTDGEKSYGADLNEHTGELGAGNTGWEGAPGTENFGEEDFAAMDEVEKAMAAQEASQFGRTVEEMEAMAELQAEMDKVDDGESEGVPSLPPSPNNAAHGANSHAAGAPPAAPRSRAVVPEGAMPSRNGVLSQHAAEFWFPECRNCPCCKGFKHGCACRSPVQDTCGHPDCVDPEHAAAMSTRAASQPRSPAASTGPISHGAPSVGPRGSPHYSSPGGAPRGPPGGGGDESSVPCKFFNSPIGCRFGSTCRNSHAGPGGAGGDGGGGGGYMPHYSPRGMPGGGGYPPNMGGRPPHMPMGPGGGGMGMGGPPGPPHQGGGSQQLCTFFQQGSCRFGAGCRFSHGV